MTHPDGGWSNLDFADGWMDGGLSGGWRAYGWDRFLILAYRPCFYL